MDPQRKTVAGPMAPSSVKAARKSFAVTNTYIKNVNPQKEIIMVHTSTPNVEHRSFHTEQNQIYQGEVNVLSIMYNTRASAYILLMPRHHSATFQGSFKNNAWKCWNNLPPPLRYVKSVKSFKAKYKLFLLNKQKQLAFYSDTNKEIMCCKYTEDVKDIAAGFIDGTIRLFDCNTGNCVHTLVDDECRAYPGPVTAIKHRPVSKAHPITNMLLSCYVNGCIKCWKYKYEQCLYTIREKRQTLGLCYHPRYSKFVTYGDDAKLNMYDEEAQTQERAFYSSQRKNIMDGHTSRIFACVFNPKSHHELISSGWDDTVMCWDDRQPYSTRYFSGVHMCGEGLDFDKPGKQILTCSWQDKDSIQIWDYGSCKVIETITPDSYQSKLYCGKLVPQTNLIVCGGSEPNIVRVVDINMKNTECSIRNNPGGVYAFDFGTIRRKPAKMPDRYKKISEIQNTPRVAFVTGKRLQTVDFG